MCYRNSMPVEPRTLDLNVKQGGEGRTKRIEHWQGELGVVRMRYVGQNWG